MSRNSSASVLQAPVTVRKPRALSEGSSIGVFSPASPAPEGRIRAGIAELHRLGFRVERPAAQVSEGYFAASEADRRSELRRVLGDTRIDGIVATRGGYGSNYLLDELLTDPVSELKSLVGFSDLTSLQIFLWQRAGWVTFCGPMVAAGLDAGADLPGGYDVQSFTSAIRQTAGGWQIPLRAECLVEGDAEGRLLGGCMTLLEATIGTPWELDTRGTILLLEDRAMKPYQVDRVLMHFKQAGKLDGVRGVVLGEFPECEPPVAGSPSVRDVCARILGPLKVPIVFGAPVGHTPRAMLTVPLGVKARLVAKGDSVLEILEPAVVQ